MGGAVTHVISGNTYNRVTIVKSATDNNQAAGYRLQVVAMESPAGRETGPSPFEQMVQRIAPQGRLLCAWPLGGGISAQMTALEVGHPEGRTERLIVRQRGDGDHEGNLQVATREFRLLQVLRSAGMAVPAPRYLDASGEIFPGPCLVLEYIEGGLEFAPTDLAASIQQLAAKLAEIHRLDCTSLELSFLPHQAPACAEIAGVHPAWLDAWWAVGRIREALASTGRPPRTNAPALLHGDYWPGNVLWHNDKLVAVIDWEDAKLGDPLADLGNSRLEIAWIFGMDAMEAFTRHYQRRMDLDYDHLPYWDLCAALRLVRLAGDNLAEWAAFFEPFGRHDITTETIRADYQTFVAQAMGGMGRLR